MTKNAAASNISDVSAATNDSSMATSFDPYGNQIIYEWPEGEYLCSNRIRLIETCNGFAEGNAKKHYDFVAPNYDGIHNYLGYPDPELVAKYAA